MRISRTVGFGYQEGKMSDQREPSRPPEFQPGHAPLPYRGPEPEYPPTSAFPPVGYGHTPPSGYGPPPPDGYGPPPPAGYGPPPDGYGPPPAGYGPPPPHRRSNTPLIALVLAIGLLLCGGLATAGVQLYQRGRDKVAEATDKIPTALPTVLPTTAPTELPTGLPNLPGLPAGQKITVKYEVTGDGPATVFYTEKLNGLPQTISDAKLPWKLTLTMEGPSVVSVWAIRRSIHDGSISCRATIDGETVSEHTASGRIATATCNKLTLN
ncbi:hypothetical protein Apa02nite_029870 [Actinoplanes palleronii]|uniref:MmpS family membrane protein n=2 Tax=Actinoplanes palleronii TaxID=113570 RepID=A0ABQ4B881_9ACTN|nr:hypothetical protein Apa02nite_029870 [Actinoplanes palleronii]